MPRGPYNALPEADSTAVFVSPFPLFPYDVVLFAIVVVCIPIRIDRL